MYMFIKFMLELNGVKYIIKFVYFVKVYIMNYNNMNEDYLEFVNVLLSVLLFLFIL